MTRRDRVGAEIRARVMRHASSRPSTCWTKKIQFVSEAEAAKAMRVLRRRGDPGADDLSPYRCWHCSRWHIGHSIGEQPP